MAITGSWGRIHFSLGIWLALHSSIAGNTNWTQWVILKRRYKAEEKQTGEKAFVRCNDTLYRCMKMPRINSNRGQTDTDKAKPLESSYEMQLMNTKGVSLEKQFQLPIK